jgi:fibronectin type 3 domain-containing protein
MIRKNVICYDHLNCDGYHTLYLYSKEILFCIEKMNHRELRFFYVMLSFIFIFQAIGGSNLIQNDSISNEKIIPDIPISDNIQSANPDPTNMTNLWPIFVNNTPLFRPHIEYDTIDDFVYVGYYIVNNTEYHHNISKYNSLKESVWNITSLGVISQSNNLIDMILSHNGSLLYVLLSFGQINFPSHYILIAYNTSTGFQQFNISINISDYTVISQMKIDEDGNNIYLIGSYSDLILIYSRLWKLDLFNQSISWVQSFGDGIHKYIYRDIVISPNSQYVYIIGDMDPDDDPETRPRNQFLLQYNSTGHLFGEYINSTLGLYNPLRFTLTPSGKYFIALMTKYAAPYQQLVMVNLELNGTWINETVLSGDNEQVTINKMTLDFKNESLIFAGQQKKFLMNTRGYLLQTNISGTLLWENSTSNPESQVQTYSDFAITKESGFIDLIGYKYQNDTIPFGGVQLYQYDLKNEPIAPHLYSLDIPSYDGSVELNWTAPLRADNFTIYRSNKTFHEIGQAELIATGITALSYIDLVPENNTYYYRIMASGTYGNSTLSNQLEMLEAEAYTPYLQPISKYNQISNTVTLNWTKPPGTIYTYYVFKNISANFTLENSIPIGETFGNYPSYIDSDITSGTWFYAVIALFNNGTIQNSTLSNIQSITIDPSIQIINSYFQGTSPFVENTTIEWDAVVGATSYRIYRQLGDFNDTTPFSAINTTINTVYFDDCPNEQTYYWLIEAFNGELKIGQSISINAYIFDSLNAPVLTQITTNITNKIVSFSWIGIAKAEFYFVLKSQSNITVFNADLIVANTTNPSYSESIEITGNYSYVVVAGRTGLNSSISNCILFSVQHLPGVVNGILILNGKDDGDWDDGRIIWKITNRSVNINWMAVENAWSYQILRYSEPITPANANFATIIGQTSGLEYQDQAIINGLNYYYNIRAYNGTGVGTINSTQTQASLIRFSPDPVILNATAFLNYSVALNWSLGNYDTIIYYLYRNTSPMNESNLYPLILSPELAAAIVYTAEENYVESNVPPGIWYYAIVAWNIHGYGNFSNCVEVEILPVPLKPELNQPTTPNYEQIVNITWYPVSMATNYTIYRSTLPITEENIGEHLAINTTSQTWYLDINLSPNTYYYVIRAQNTSGLSVISNLIYIQIIHLPNAPNWIPPLNSYFVNRIDITWTDAFYYDNYSIYSTTSATWNQTTAVLIADHIWQNTFQLNVSDELNRFYWIFAYNSSGRSVPTTSIELKGYIMEKPSINLLSNNPTTNHTIIFSWNNVTWATTYEIHRSISSDFTPSISTRLFVFSNNDTFIQNDVPLGKYYYLLLPVSNYGAGDPSAIIEIRVEDRPPPTVLVKIITLKESTFMVVWDLIPEAEGYIAYYSRFPITNQTNLSNLTTSPILNKNTYNYTFNDIGIGTFYFAVVAINGTGSSEYSNLLTVSNLKARETPKGIYIMIAAFSSVGGIIGTLFLIKYIKDRKNDPELLLKRHGLDL